MEYASIFNSNYNCALMADAAFRAGVELSTAPSSLLPVAPHMKLSGPVTTVQANNDLISILAAVHRAQQGDIIAIGNPVTEVALLGDLIALEAKRKRLGGIVVDGFVRDVSDLIKIDVPIFCKGVCPIGPLKLPKAAKGIGQIGTEIVIGDSTIVQGSWAFGDADGVLFVSQADLLRLYKEAEKAHQREEQLSEAIRTGMPLGDLLAIESFIEKRAADATADFNEHLAQLGKAI